MDRWKMYCGGTWVLSPEGEFLFWTPFPFRHMRNTLIIGNCLKIDFSNFVHGDEWVKCQEPLQSIKTRGGQGMEVIGDEGVIPHHFSMQIYFSLLPDTHHRYTVIYHLHPHFIILLFFVFAAYPWPLPSRTQSSGYFYWTRVQNHVAAR